MRRTTNTTNWKTNMISQNKIPPYREFAFNGTTVAYDLFSLADMIHHAQNVRRNVPKRPHNRQPVTYVEAAGIISRARGMGWVPESERVGSIGSIAHSSNSSHNKATTSTANSSSTNETYLIVHSMGLVERWLQGISRKYKIFAAHNPHVNDTGRSDIKYYKKVHQFLNDSLIPIRMKMHEVGGHLVAMNVVPLTHNEFRIDIEVGRLATSYTIRFDVQSRRKAGSMTLTVLFRAVTVLTRLVDFTEDYIDAANFSWKRVFDAMRTNSNSSSSSRNWKREVLSMVLAQQKEEEENRRKRRRRGVINLTGSP